MGIYENVYLDGDHANVADVRAGVSYANEQLVGVLNIDAEANLPAVEVVIAPNKYGSQNQLTGVYNEVTVDDVRLSKAFGPNSSLVGTVIIPEEQDVRIGTVYDSNGSRTGTLDVSGNEPIFPPQEDVRNAVQYGTTQDVLTGNYQPADPAKYLAPNLYGARGIEFTGQLQVPQSSDERSIRFKINSGDDYLAADGRQLTFQNPQGLDLSGSQLWLTVVGAGYQQLIYVPTASLDAQGNPVVELTSAQTSVQSGTYRWDIRGRLASGAEVTVDRGWCQIALAYTKVEDPPA